MKSRQPDSGEPDSAFGNSVPSEGESFSFGRERRILRRSDFLRVQAVGERASTSHFVLLVAPRIAGRDCASPKTAASRLGVVVTKKIGNSPARNRIKRLCRECFRLWPGFVPNGIDLVVIARAGADALTLAQVHDQWERAHAVVLRRCTTVLARPEGFVPPPRPRGDSAGSRGRGPKPNHPKPNKSSKPT